MKHLETKTDKVETATEQKLESASATTTTTTTKTNSEDANHSKKQQNQNETDSTLAVTTRAASPPEKAATTKMVNDLEDDKEKHSEMAAQKMPTIVLSDNEEATGPGGAAAGGAVNSAPAPPNKTKKRRSTGPAVSGVAVPYDLSSISMATIAAEDLAILKRRKINVPGAPKMPVTAFVRYMNERRDPLRRQMPGTTHNEQNKIIAEEWHQLSDAQKAPYIRSADSEKQRYDLELTSFLTARPDVLATELAKDMAKRAHHENGKKESPVPVVATVTNQTPATALQQAVNGGRAHGSSGAPAKRKRTPTPTPTPVPSGPPVVTTGEIPIFTNEFLEHNKVFDMELRGLRKTKTDLEQQNAVLEKHVENMKFGVEKMTSENDELAEKNRLLEIYLLKLKKRLAQALSGLAIPSEPNGATVDNIDKYMNDLYKMATSNTHGPASLNKAKDIIRKLDLQIQL